MNKILHARLLDVLIIKEIETAHKYFLNGYLAAAANRQHRTHASLRMRIFHKF